MRKIALLFILAAGWLTTTAQEEARLLRFPAIHGNQIVFTYAGDLYTVDAQGGVARRLTSDAQGYEMFARFSPDGKKIAFSGQYDGNTEVYTMPAEGGQPTRITYTATLQRDDISDRMGPNNMVVTWKDNNSVVYRSRKQSFNDFKGQLFEVPAEGGVSEPLPFACAGFGTFSPDGSKMAYNRVMREFRTWKYYQGGMADDVWIFDYKTKKNENITQNSAQDIFPMWANNKIYYLSDRDRIMNLFVYDLVTKSTTKVTNFNDYDIKFPSLGDNAIVFEKGGYIYRLDLATQKVEQIHVVIRDDYAANLKGWRDADKNISSADVSPDGKRIVFGARGDVFTVPAKSGITRNLTTSCGANDRNVAWSPDGKSIAFISDKDGNNALYVIPEPGGEAKKIFAVEDTWMYDIQWSPDSRYIAWSDKLQRLQYVEVSSGKRTIVTTSPFGELRDFSWSPDSRWIAYTNPVYNAASRIMIYELASAKSKEVTSSWYDSGSPVFSSDGKYLFFTSNRDFNPVYSWTEWNHVYQDMSRVYMVTLKNETPSPFAPENDEVEVKADTKADANAKKTDASKDKGTDKKAVEAGVTVTIDFDGIEGRTIQLSEKAAAYWGLNSTGDMVYYFRASSTDEQPVLLAYNLADKKEVEIGNINSYILAAGGKKMLVSMRGKYAVIDTPRGKCNPDQFVDLSQMKIFVDFKAEWQQIYAEAWRQMRDFFYDANMHGVNWNDIYKKYQVLVPYVSNRNDLNYIMGEMIGELNTGHAYINGGDKPAVNRIKTGLLGATIVRDKSGYFKVESILEGENWNKEMRSPLTELGVNVKPGDFIIAVDDVPVTKVKDLYELLINKADVLVQLTVNSTASESGSRKVLVKPIENEASLYYYNWVQKNIRYVNEKTNGEVGYIHIPDMGVEGLNEFVKHYYPQLNKRALIIDDRGNGGGNVSPMIIERLKRQLVIMAISRNGSPTTKPEGMQWGPKVLLLDRYSASDGDLFPYQFKTLKMGKTIGVRSWGGVVGIRGPIPFMDGGTLNRPEFAHYDAEGKQFVIEGHGVDPDIVVDNDMYDEFNGKDAQLDKAIEVIKEDLKAWPKDLPGVPKYPVK